MTSPLLASDDPRQLRALFDRAALLAHDHQISSVFVGIAGVEGDLLAPDFIDFVESELRVEDSVFRLLRERAVLLLTDVERGQAEAVMERLRSTFIGQFAPSASFEVALGFEQVDAARPSATAKDILPALFAPSVARKRG